MLLGLKGELHVLDLARTQDPVDREDVEDVVEVVSLVGGHECVLVFDLLEETPVLVDVEVGDVFHLDLDLLVAVVLDATEDDIGLLEV